MNSECMELQRRCNQGTSRVVLMLPSMALPCKVHVTLMRSHMRLGELAASFHALHTRGTFCTLHAHAVTVSKDKSGSCMDSAPQTSVLHTCVCAKCA